MASNRGLAYMGPGKVEVQSIDFPKLALGSRKCEHGVILSDMIPERLAQAKSFGCETIDLRKDATLGQQIEQIVGMPEVECAVDCVGFEARGHGKETVVERPATVLNSL